MKRPFSVTPTKPWHFAFIGCASLVLAPLALIHLRLTDRDGYRYCRLGDWLSNAYARGNYEEAERMAHELLALSESQVRTWNRGNAIHTGHQALGLIALKRNDILSARSHLLAAGDTPGSPTLNSYGPEMLLARELLECGEGEAVIDYLDRVASFWAKDDARFPEHSREKKRVLKQWKAIIRKGGIPDDPRWRRWPDPGAQKSL